MVELGTPMLGSWVQIASSLPSFLENGLICPPLWLVNIWVCWRHFFIQDPCPYLFNSTSLFIFLNIGTRPSFLEWNYHRQTINVDWHYIVTKNSNKLRIGIYTLQIVHSIIMAGLKTEKGQTASRGIKPATLGLTPFRAASNSSGFVFPESQRPGKGG